MSEARDADWIETEEVKGSIPPWRKDDGTSHRRQREPMNWPMAVVLVVLLGVGAFGIWVCGGVATEWISQ